MRISTRTLCLKLLVVVAVPVDCWAIGPDLHSQLLSEPMWILQTTDGAAAQVWFEERDGTVRMMRCTANRPECHEKVALDAADVVIEASGAPAMRLHLVSPDLPAFVGPAASLFPAWVVPGAQSRTGH